MPYKSKSQARLFRLKERRGELPPGTASQWARHTPVGIKALPERVGHGAKKNKKKAAMLQSLSELASQGNLLATMIVGVHKTATIGRQEGFGSTNGLAPSNANLLSLSTLSKPGGPGAPASMAPAGGALSMAGGMKPMSMPAPQQPAAPAQAPMTGGTPPMPFAPATGKTS